MPNPEYSGTYGKSSSPARLAIFLCVAWLLTGALFKLFYGSPNDLPPTVLELSPFNAYDTFRGAIAAEIAIACLALVWPRLGWFPLAAIFLVFLAVLGKLIAAGAESCGCLGSSVKLAPWQMMAIDGSLLALLLWSAPWKRIPKTERAVLRVVALVPLFGLAVFLPWTKFIVVELPPKLSTESNQANAPTEIKGDFYLFNPPTWEGQMIFDIDLGKFANPADSFFQIPPSHVVLYRKSCEHCKEHIEGLALNPPTDQAIVLIRVPEIDDANVTDIIELKPEGAIELELTPLSRGYGITTPMSFDVDESLMVHSVTEIQHE